MTGISYCYATNPKSEHDIRCQFYEKFTDKEVIQLFKKNSPSLEDLERVDDLIKQTLLASLRQYLKGDKQEKIESDAKIPSGGYKLKAHVKGVEHEKSRLYIQRVAIKKIGLEQDCFNRLVCVHGKVNISVKTHEHLGYKNKRIIFLKNDGKTRFSIYLNQYLANELGIQNDMENETVIPPQNSFS